MRKVRTTVTLDPDVELLVKRAMQERGLSFKEAINEAIRAGMAPRRRGPPPRVATRSMGQPRIDLTKALQIAGELEDEERIRALAQGR
jgi:hypothetical protein